MDDFEKELKIGFLEEASQLLSDAERCFLNLEHAPQDPTIIDLLFRLAHNLKGSAKAVGFEDMGEFTHKLESFLLKVKQGEIKIASATVSLLLRCNDQLLMMVARLKEDLGARVDSAVLMSELEAFLSGNGPVSVEAAAPAEVQAMESQFAGDLPSQFAGELPPHFIPSAASFDELHSVVQASIPAAAPSASAGSGQSGVAEESIRVSLARLDKLINYVGEMVILQTVLSEQAQTGNPLLLKKTVNQLGKVTKEIQDISMSLRMVALKQTFQKMQRIVRDTSNALSKKVHLNIHGEETELDKTVLEHLSDPLVHLIRNAVDHGIESGDQRIVNGKPEAGTIHLAAFHEGGSIVIEVKDDGGGIDAARLKMKAIEKGLIRSDSPITEKEAQMLIFHPGFSTKSEVTDISGRGVGLDVVRTNIERLQGQIVLDTVVGKGTCFRITLPLTLAIIDGMVVRCEEQRYIIPLTQVHECVQPEESDIHFATGFGEVFSLRGEHLPLFRLSNLLGRKTIQRKASEMIAIVVRSGKRPFSVLVDDVIGQHQVVIKSLGQEIQHLKGFSGSAILGDGRPALILELPDLVKARGASSQVNAPGATSSSRGAGQPPAPAAEARGIE
ncbi:MAG: chemotaxis protein CheA [Methylotenera sp.]|nr:chemotaxis protein CheA [Oligoflexia bacterium]